MPKGSHKGRPSRSFSLRQASAILAGKSGDPMHAYIVMSLLTGIRTEEARALKWENVFLDGLPDTDPPMLPHVHVWRSVRGDGDTKTAKPRRTLGLPGQLVDVLRKHKAWQAEVRLKAGEKWHDDGYVFTTGLGTPLDASNVRRDFRRALEKVDGIDPDEWTPRELRHSFVSLLSEKSRSKRSHASSATRAEARSPR